MVFVVAACESEDEAFVREFLLDWAGNDIGGTLGGVTGFGKGNEVTAILDAVKVIDKVNQADGLAEEGRKGRDIKKFDEAIALSPKDWTYRTSRAVANLDIGSISGYDADVRQAQALSPDRKIGGTTVSGSDREVRQRYTELRSVEARLTADLEAKRRVDGERCSKIFGEMAAMSAQLQNAARTANNIVEFEQWGVTGRAWRDKQATCPPP
jgi:hypothetical protein